MANAYPTPHIAATPGDFGKTVLMPGDPLRSKFIAETYLERPKLVNDVRGIQGYTGYYQGVKLSVMASGMGMPSMGIYSHELFNVFEVENILMEHPAVLECSVVGIPDPLRGQAIKAVVVPVPEREPSKTLEREIRTFCNSRLAEYKWVRTVEFVAAMPKTISGKIRKTELRT